eukprot:6200266-Pleurochrysis_carterae.AAC.2
MLPMLTEAELTLDIAYLASTRGCAWSLSHEEAPCSVQQHRKRGHSFLQTSMTDTETASALARKSKNAYQAQVSQEQASRCAAQHDSTVGRLQSMQSNMLLLVPVVQMRNHLCFATQHTFYGTCADVCASWSLTAWHDLLSRYSPEFRCSQMSSLLRLKPCR